MRVIIHPEAQAELDAAADWYEERHPGLGLDFLDEFERTLDRILADPQRWRRIRGENRKLTFHRFPYAIIYLVRVEGLHITAVMHQHRRPFFWLHRQP